VNGQSITFPSQPIGNARIFLQFSALPGIISDELTYFVDTNNNIISNTFLASSYTIVQPGPSPVTGPTTTPGPSPVTGPTTTPGPSPVTITINSVKVRASDSTYTISITTANNPVLSARHIIRYFTTSISPGTSSTPSRLVDQTLASPFVNRTSGTFTVLGTVFSNYVSGNMVYFVDTQNKVISNVVLVDDFVFE
jgi:hypothetical protein